MSTGHARDQSEGSTLSVEVILDTLDRVGGKGVDILPLIIVNNSSNLLQYVHVVSHVPTYHPLLVDDDSNDCVYTDVVMDYFRKMTQMFRRSCFRIAQSESVVDGK